MSQPPLDPKRFFKKNIIDEQQIRFINVGPNNKNTYELIIDKLMCMSQTLMDYEHIPGEIPETFRRDMIVQVEILKVMEYLKNHKEILCKED
jgi:hypothetical protein